MSNMPDSFTAFSDSLSWAMLRFPAPGIPIPDADDDALMLGNSTLPFSSRVKKAKLAGTVFWNGLGLVGIVIGHVTMEYYFFKKGKEVPAVLAFPAAEIKLVTLSLPGLLSTSMAVMADRNIGAGYTCLGTLVVLASVAFILVCLRVLQIMEKRKPVRFKYAESFKVGMKGEKSTFREAPLKWKVFSLLSYKKLSLGSWETQAESFEEFEKGGWDGLLPPWVTLRLFGDPVRTTEQAEQFHRNWSPLYAKFRGSKGKLNYIVEMGNVFFM